MIRLYENRAPSEVRMTTIPTPRRIVAPPVVALGIILNALAAVVFGGLHLFGDPPPLRAVAWPGAVALAGAYALAAAPGAGGRGRPRRGRVRVAGSGGARGRLRPARGAGRRGAAQPAAGRAAGCRAPRRAARVHRDVGRVADPGPARGLLSGRLRGLDTATAPGTRGGRR